MFIQILSTLSLFETVGSFLLRNLGVVLSRSRQLINLDLLSLCFWQRKFVSRLLIRVVSTWSRYQIFLLFHTTLENFSTFLVKRINLKMIISWTGSDIFVKLFLLPQKHTSFFIVILFLIIFAFILTRT